MSKFFINGLSFHVISIIMVIIGIVAMVRLPIAQFPSSPRRRSYLIHIRWRDALTLEQSVQRRSSSNCRVSIT